MMLRFTTCSFSATEIKSFSVELIKAPNWKVGDGSRRIYSIELENGKTHVLEAHHVIEPEGNTDIYFKYKDPAWAALAEMYIIQFYGKYSSHMSADAKAFALKFNYPKE